VIVAIIFVFAINAFLDWSHKKDKSVTDKANVKSDTKKLKVECSEISKGFDVSEVGLVLISSNRTTKVTTSSGSGHIKYWNTSNITQVIPEKGICKVTFDSEGVVTEVAWIE
jgi:hypothetical protein